MVQPEGMLLRFWRGLRPELQVAMDHMAPEGKPTCTLKVLYAKARELERRGVGRMRAVPAAPTRPSGPVPGSGGRNCRTCGLNCPDTAALMRHLDASPSCDRRKKGGVGDNGGRPLVRPAPPATPPPVGVVGAGPLVVLPPLVR